MNKEIKNTLDLRLAKGEITNDEYQSLIKIIENSGGVEEISYSKYLEPILRYKDELLLYNDYLIHNGEKYLYSQIEKVLLCDDELTVNLISISPTWYLFITMIGENKSSVEMKAYSPMIKTPKFYFMRKAYNFLIKKTSSYILSQAINNLKSQGALRLSTGIYLNKNGIVTNGEKELNLIDVNHNGFVNYGDVTNTSWFNGNKSTYRNMFIIAPNKNCKDKDCIIFQNSGIYYEGVVKYLLVNFEQLKYQYL